MQRKIDHMRLVPGIYLEKTSGDVSLIDVRMKRPNFDTPLSPEVSHTIEHMGTMFMERHPALSDKFVCLSPRGCFTGFRIVLNGNFSGENFGKAIVAVLSMMEFIVGYKGNAASVGFDPESCGDYTLVDIDGAQTECANFIVLHETFGCLGLRDYPTEESNPGIETSTHIDDCDVVNTDLKRARRIRKPVKFVYEPVSEEREEIGNAEFKKEEVLLERPDRTIKVSAKKTKLVISSNALF